MNKTNFFYDMMKVRNVDNMSNILI